ncbi:MAG: single-stranded-DNA-specific exonuclease RecJ [Blastocatellia bacterium]|nr:single-stranded-DNA-specific exonuclease RecJ [Blastocatellia bacterium]
MLTIAHTLGLFETTASILAIRGIDSPEVAEKFISPSINDLNSPFLMADMHVAVERIKRAIEKKEKILIHGDYDVDGTMATVILKHCLMSIGASVGYYIPQRLVDGCGMKENCIDWARSEGYTLLISVDCGIRAHSVIDYARLSGIDVIVTDHHPPEGDIPTAVAVLNPKRSDCFYPEKNLAGCGVAFKLAQALIEKYKPFNKNRKECEIGSIESLMKIAAIGTIADMVPLLGENRVIAKRGLVGLSSANNFGLKALLEVAGISGRSLNCNDIGFKLAPRINAVGRMGGASAAVELFTAADPKIATKLAQELNEQNFVRQKTEAEIIGEVMERLEKDPSVFESPVIVLAAEGWHRGVIGIAASKIVEKIHKPAIVISIEGNIGYGSGRSVRGFSLLDGLNNCRELFERYGGHSQAAGLTIKADLIDSLKESLRKFATEKLKENQQQDFTPSLDIDTELSFAEINQDLIKEISSLEPFGVGNPYPLFLARGVKIVDGPKLFKGKHLKFALSHRGHVLDAVWWGAVTEQKFSSRSEELDLVFSLGENYWSPSQIQISIKDMKVGVTK